MATAAPVAASAAASEAGLEIVRAIRNAFKLGGSLLATWSVALVVRLLVPRLLGPELFGPLSFAESFAALFFVAAGLGLEVYIRKEIPVRPDHASDFVGGVLLLQLGLAALLFGAMAVALELGNRPSPVRLTAFVFAGAQLAVTLNNTFAALLHSKGEVGGLSVVNVGGKLLWAAGVLAAVLLGPSLPGIAAALFAAEAVKAALLFRLARRHLRLRLRANLTAARRVVLVSLPFYLNTVAYTAAGKLDVSLLSFLVDSDVEVGWYGAAMNLAGLSMLIAPIVGWVVLPLLARARARSPADFAHAARRALEWVLCLALPLALGMALGADLWIGLMFGDAYAPAAPALRWLSPMFVLSYAANLAGLVLILENRGWRLTLVSLAGLAANLLLNLALIRPFAAALGPGGAGIGSAVAHLITELSVAALLVRSTHARLIDARLLGRLARGAAVCVLVAGLDRVLSGLGPERIALDAVACLGLVVLFRAVPLEDLRRLLAQRRGRLRTPTPPPADGDAGEKAPEPVGMA